MLNIEEFGERDELYLLINPRSEEEWIKMRDVILEVLEAYPAAREAVVKALTRLNAMGKGLPV